MLEGTEENFILVPFFSIGTKTKHSEQLTPSYSCVSKNPVSNTVGSIIRFTVQPATAIRQASIPAGGWPMSRRTSRRRVE